MKPHRSAYPVNQTMKGSMQAFKQHCVEQYDQGQPIISDAEFDSTFGDVNHHESQEVIGTQATLPVWMGSLSKIRTNHQLYLWSSKYKDASLELTSKLDGVSGLLGPQATFLYQRGNGKVGQDISKIIPHLNLPKVPYLVRGEIIMPVDTFDTYYKSYKNPRNLVAGLLHQKNPDPQDLQRLHFVAYEIVQDDSDLDFISRLEQDQFKVPLRSIIQPQSEPFSFDKLYNTLDLTSYLYETDGVVVRAQVTCQRVTSGNPKHMIALKLDSTSDVAVTEVIRVSWNISKWSLLFPVVHLKPVHLRGVTISNVTGNNATFIRDNQIGPGTILKIKRSGGVIPKIVKVLEPSPKEFCGPEIPYEWSGVHIKKLTKASSIVDVEVLQARLLTTLKGLEIKHLGPKGVHKLLPEVQSFLDIVRLIKDDQFIQVSSKVGISSVIALKVQGQLQSLLFKEGVSAALLIGHMGTFGPNISYKRLQSIGEVIPTFLRSETIELKDLCKVKGLAKLAEVIYEGYSEAYNVVLNLETLGVKFVWPEEGIPQGSLQGPKGPLQMKIVYSGFRDLGVDNDISPCSCVSSKTDLLVVKTLQGSTGVSTKVGQARKLGVKIMTRDDFVKEFQGHLKLKL